MAKVRAKKVVITKKEVSRYMIEADDEAIAWFKHETDRDIALTALREEHPDSEFIDSEEYE